MYAITREIMPGFPESIPLGECMLSQSKDELTPPTRTASMALTLSRSDSLWAAEPALSRCQVFWFPIHFMSTGGTFLVCGAIMSALYFTGHCRRVTNILGPALLSIGLMVFVVGAVLIPITKQNRKRLVARRPPSFHKPPAFNL